MSSLLPCRKEARIPGRELGALVPEASDAVFADFMSHFLLKNKELRPLSKVSKAFYQVFSGYTLGFRDTTRLDQINSICFYL